MRLFDKKFLENKRKYIFQCLAGGLIIFIILLFLNIVFGLTVAASIGASTFIAYTMPHVKSAAPRYLIGGYTVGCVCAIIGNVFYHLVQNYAHLFSTHTNHIFVTLVCGITVSLAMFFMTIFDMEHPPAVALALGLVKEPYIFVAASAALFSIIVISGSKEVF